MCTPTPPGAAGVPAQPRSHTTFVLHPGCSMPSPFLKASRVHFTLRTKDTAVPASSPVGRGVPLCQLDCLPHAFWRSSWVGCGSGSSGDSPQPAAPSPSRVLSSQFLALCERHPSLVVELAKELLEFVGSGSGMRSGGSMLTSVVRPGGRPPPDAGPAWAWQGLSTLP